MEISSFDGEQDGASRIINVIRRGALPCVSEREKLFHPEPSILLLSSPERQGNLSEGIKSGWGCRWLIGCLFLPNMIRLCV